MCDDYNCQESTDFIFWENFLFIVLVYEFIYHLDMMVKFTIKF